MTKAMLTIMPALRGELTMFRDKVNPLRRHRAVTLIEAVLYISIALALIVGGLVFFQQASTAAKTSTMVRQLSALLVESRVLLKQMTYESDIEITSLLIAAGAVPPGMVIASPLPGLPPDELHNPFGGETYVYGFKDYSTGGPVDVIQLSLRNVPQQACARLLTATSGVEFSSSGGVGGTTIVSSGYVYGSVGTEGYPSDRNYLMNPTQAGWMCKYGSDNYDTKTNEPSSTPLSGNLRVNMYFLKDG
jgi:hypothetical protein